MSGRLLDSQKIPTVSVIVPVYNTERYLVSCLDSIAAQSYPSLEVILVDDGSPDSSGVICDRYADGHEGWRVIHKENGGMSDARNAGIEVCTGERLFFVDADDAIHPDAISTLSALMDSSGVPLAIGSFSREPLPAQPLPKDVETHLWDAETAMEKAFYQEYLINAVWNVLYSRDLWSDDMRFHKGIAYEDLDIFYRLFERAGRVAYTSAETYYYRPTPGSVVNTFSEMRFDVLDVADRIVRFAEERYPSLLPAARSRSFSAHYNMLLLIIANGLDYPVQKERCLSAIRRMRLAELRDPKVRLKNRIGALASYFGTRVMRMLGKGYRLD